MSEYCRECARLSEECELLSKDNNTLNDRVAELEAAEHRARCDLMDALFYVDILAGRYGMYGPTKGERTIAGDFGVRMRIKYPHQKGRATSVATSDAGTEHG